MIPTPIRQVLLTMRKHQVQALLMGGQACVFYGAAQFSKDVALVLLANAENYTRLQGALANLEAHRITVPRFDPMLLARGHGDPASTRSKTATNVGRALLRQRT